MKYTWIIFFAFCFFPYNGWAQQSDSEINIIQVQKIKESCFFYLADTHDIKEGLTSNIQLNYILKYTSDGGKTFKLQQLDTINNILKVRNPISEINIFFVNELIGFIYGYVTGYGFEQFLFRTDDSGKTWATLNDIQARHPLRRCDFFMFNEKQGILLSNWNNEPNFNYSITTDGGKIWTQRSFKLSIKNFRILNSDRYLNTVFSVDGLCTIIFTNPDFENNKSNKVIILQSKNFGQDFYELK